MQGFIDKAEESLAGAASELLAQRYNNSANRAYYACFQAAVFALWRAGTPTPAQGIWSHAFVQAEFAGQLVNRRKLYAPELREALPRLRDLRVRADYVAGEVARTAAERAVRRAREFVAAVRERSGQYRG